MNVNVRERLEKIIVSSLIYDEEFFLEIKSRDIETSDFKSVLCAKVFEIVDSYFERETVMPSEKIVSQELLGYLYKTIKDPQRINACKEKYTQLLAYRENDLDSFNVHLSNFCAAKMKDGVLNILNNAKSLAEDKDISEVLDYILDAYVTSYNSKSEIDGINFYDLMRKDIDAYSPYAENIEVVGNTAKTGIYYLDKNYLNGGVLEGNMCIIAGRPGSGKTTLAKVIALNNAREGKKVAFVSLEMSKEQIAQGYYAQLARVELGKILRKELCPEDYQKMLTAIEQEENKLPNYHVIESDSLTVSELINLLIRYRKKHGIEVLVLDYIQQIRLPNGSVPKNETEYSLVSELIRTIIKKLGLHGFICAQVNRDCEKRVDKHPIASDLRSSGKLEQDAAYILTTYRDEIYDQETDHPKTMDISVAKNRFGPMGMVRVTFEGEYQNIEDLIDGDLGN